MPDGADKLRQAGLRVTAARVAILDAVRHSGHLDADAVARAVRGRVGHVTIQAVYEALHALTAAGLLRRIQPAGSPARYEQQNRDNHHHIVCRNCGAVADVECVIGHAPCLEPASSLGYSIDEAEVTFWGRCPSCTTALAPAAASTEENHSQEARNDG